MTSNYMVVFLSTD
jgi:hypothetical protein